MMLVDLDDVAENATAVGIVEAIIRISVHDGNKVLTRPALMRRQLIDTPMVEIENDTATAVLINRLVRHGRWTDGSSFRSSTW